MDLKKIISLTLSCVSFTCFSQIQVEILNGCDNPTLKSKIEKNASRFFDETIKAFNSNRALDLTGIVDPNGELSIEMLWENVHFKPEVQYIGEILLSDANGGFQIRNIPLVLHPIENGNQNNYKEAVMKFDNEGNIISLHFSLGKDVYEQILEKGKILNDQARRLEILDYMERLRSSLIQKDIDFIKNVFLNDSISFNIVYEYQMSQDIDLENSNNLVKFTKNSFDDYVGLIDKVFQGEKFFNANILDIQIKKHGVNPNMYGVNFELNWQSSDCSDEKYVFMLWDFSTQEFPIIQTKVMQPKWLDLNKTIPLPEEEIFDLNSIEGL